ncbi:MAG: Lrp/AsnC family transcriptional regulator [Roseobacter sp.]
MVNNISDIDLLILDTLQHDSSVSHEEMSEIVGRSATSCLRRTRKLTEDGIILQRVALLDEEKLGFDITGIFSVELAQDVIDLDIKLEAICSRNPQIQQCFIVSSGADFMFIAKFRDAAEYKDFIFRLIGAFEGIEVREYESRMVVKSVHDHRFLPIRPSQKNISS